MEVTVRIKDHSIIIVRTNDKILTKIKITNMIILKIIKIKIIKNKHKKNI
jgi:hypothetical protein